MLIRKIENHCNRYPERYLFLSVISVNTVASVAFLYFGINGILNDAPNKNTQKSLVVLGVISGSNALWNTLSYCCGYYLPRKKKREHTEIV
jgi:uncharacterized BrkB/YihY/UPF0761 family membrane protein